MTGDHIPVVNPNDTALLQSSVVTNLLARCTFGAPGTVVHCGVSGGADSVALLILASAAQLQVTAVHIDHGLRPNSDGESAFVAALALRFGAQFVAAAVVVEPGPNIEARARRARLDALGTGALVGHTADDQAETVLLSLMRGTGLDGLAAMNPVTHPLLALRRHDTEGLCAQFGIEPFHDPSNDDLSFRRNSVRHRLIPMMNDIAQRDVVPLLARTAELVAEETAELAAAADAIDPTDCRALLAAPEPLARRALRRWLSDPYPPNRAGLDRVWEVVTGQVIGCELAGGDAIRRTNGKLRRVVHQEK
jgi:tRNA(Ile)-lysidine synthase